ncbi:hypothetical protein Tco_1291673 [Tanacetum coccineum]
MSSIDTYSTTKDLVFDEWVSSHRSDEIRFDVYFDGRFFMCPLKYEDETILDLRLPMSKRLSFKEMNDLLLDKTKEDIWKWFYCKPKCTLEEGLTIVENDRDIEKMFGVVKLQGALDLYVCPIPQLCLVEYYFKNLDVVFEFDEEVTSIYRGHEKAKNDASTMSFEEIVAWEKEELQSPSYLRSPHVWKSNSVGIGKGKVLLDDFEIVGNGKDKVVLDDAKDGLISTKSDGDRNEGSSSSSNLN